MSSNAPTEPQDSDLAYDLLNCMAPGKCGDLKYLNKKDVKVDLAFEIGPNTKKFTDKETGDLILKDVRILSPGVRNGYEYDRKEVENVRSYKGLKSMPINGIPFMAFHSSNPLDQIGRAEDVGYDHQADSIVSKEVRIFNDEKLPAAQAAIALINREKGFLSVSTRLKAEPNFTEGKKPSVRNLRLIHVAWVDVGADPTAGVHMSNDESVIDNLLPTSDKDAWDGSGSERRVWEWANQDANKAKAAYFYSADNPQKQGDLKLPFADIIGGTLTAVKGGVQAAYGAMRGAHGNTPSIPSGDVAGVMAKIHGYYTKFGLPWPLDESSNSERSDKLDTTQHADADGVDTHNIETENRGSTMAKDKVTPPVEEEEKPTDNVKSEPVTPPKAAEETIAPIVNNQISQSSDVVISLTQQELDLKIEQALREHDDLMQIAYRRKEMVSEIMKIDNSVKTEFLVTLTEEQLAEVKVTIERHQTALEKLAMENAELKRNFPAAGFEKPSYGGTPAFGVDMAEIEKVYPSKTKQQQRREASIQQMTAMGMKQQKTGDE